MTEQQKWVIKFEIRVETPKGVFWCAYIRQPESEGEVAAGMSDDRGDNQHNKNMQLNPAIKMSIEQAHAILGHSSEGKTHKQQQHLAFSSREVHSRPSSHVQLQKQSKRSKFSVAKSNMPKDMCIFMQQEKSRGYPISIIRQDNIGENKKLVTLAN